MCMRRGVLFFCSGGSGKPQDSTEETETERERVKKKKREGGA